MFRVEFFVGKRDERRRLRRLQPECRLGIDFREIGSDALGDDGPHQKEGEGGDDKGTQVREPRLWASGYGHTTGRFGFQVLAQRIYAETEVFLVQWDDLPSSSSNMRRSRPECGENLMIRFRCSAEGAALRMRIGAGF